MKLSHYVRHVLVLACNQKLKVKTHYVVSEGEPLKVAEDSDK